jgi:hypothetical protein
MENTPLVTCAVTALNVVCPFAVPPLEYDNGAPLEFAGCHAIVAFATGLPLESVRLFAVTVTNPEGEVA